MNTIELSILIPAFIAGLLVLSTHIPLGMKVLARGVIFADLAIAQIAGLGVITSTLLLHGGNPWVVQSIAASSALAGALLLSWIEQAFEDVKEAAIGLTFVLAACAGILLMNSDLQAGEHLKDMLVGQILWVSKAPLIATALLSAVLLLLLRWRGSRLGTLGFYSMFALAVTASVQLVGVYLVFASLIIPALATHRLQRHRYWVAGLVGTLGYALGLWLSASQDWPSGAAIVWSMAIVGGVSVLLQRLWR